MSMIENEPFPYDALPVSAVTEQTKQSSTPRTDALKLDKFGAAGLMVEYDKLCRVLECENAVYKAQAEALREESEFQHCKNTDIYGRLCKAEAEVAAMSERVQQFDAAITRIANYVGAVCGGVDTESEGFGRGGHTAEEIIRCIDNINQQNDGLRASQKFLHGERMREAKERVIAETKLASIAKGASK